MTNRIPHSPNSNSGRCPACGRRLTSPESIAAGIGPHCRTQRATRAKAAATFAAVHARNGPVAAPDVKFVIIRDHDQKLRAEPAEYEPNLCPDLKRQGYITAPALAPSSEIVALWQAQAVTPQLSVPVLPDTCACAQCR